MRSMILKFFLALSFIFSGCFLLPREKPDCSHLSSEAIKLISVNPGYGGAKENAGYYHRLVIDNYSDACIDRINFLKIAYHYIDTVKADRPIRGVSFYDAVIPFQEAEESGEDENHEKVAKSLIVEFTFLTPYDSVENRQFHGISFSRGGYYVSFPLKGIALQKQ